MRRALIVAPIVVLLATTGFSGRTTTTIPVIEPGSSDITTHILRESMDSVRSIYKATPTDTLERVVATTWRESHLVAAPQGKAMLLVSSSVSARGTFVDSALVLLDGLSPVWEILRRNKRATRFDYNGARVRVAIADPDSTFPVREHEYPLKVFHFNELDVLLRSLPLREGYEVILPLYSEGTDVLEMDTLQVLKRDRSNVWTLRFADPAIIAMIGIDETTREEMSYSRVIRSDGSVLRKSYIGRRISR